MVRTKLVPKRTNIRQWPPRERYTNYKIKTLLPDKEQRTIDMKKKRSSSLNGNCQQKKTKVYGPLGEKFLNHACAELGKSRCRKKPNS